MVSEIKEIEADAVNLKYYDNEGDLISVSSDLELEYAISLCNNNVLRLVMETRNVRQDEHLFRGEQGSVGYGGRAESFGHFGGRGEGGFGHFGGRGEGFGHFGGRSGHFGRGRNSSMRGGGRFPGHDAVSWRGEKLKKVKELDAQFVGHSLVEDNSSIPAGTKFFKSWRFRNIGSSLWPEGSSLIRVSKYHNNLSAPDSIPVASIGPYQEIDVTVELKTPIVPGQYDAFFRLCAPWGKKFGQRVRCRVFAVDQFSMSREKTEAIWNNLEEMKLVQKGERPGKIAEIIAQQNGDINHIVREILNIK
jgi:hypothetical protein